MRTFIYYGRLQGLNEGYRSYTQTARKGRRKYQGFRKRSASKFILGNATKQKIEKDLSEDFFMQAQGWKLTEHAYVRITFWEKDNRRDDDNVYGEGSKHIMDALKKAGIIPDDSPKWVHVIPERKTLPRGGDSGLARIVVEILPDSEGEEFAIVKRARNAEKGLEST